MVRRDSIGGRGINHLLIIGEAPGEVEDILGIPFSGPSGRVLDYILKEVTEPFSFVITNTVCCRPQTLVTLERNEEDEVTEQEEQEDSDKPVGEWGLDYTIEDFNREPTQEEMKACSPHIDELIETEKFDGVVYAGNVAKNYHTKLPTVSILHPAAILRKEYKYLPVLREARKITKFLHKLSEARHEKGKYEMPTRN